MATISETLVVEEKKTYNLSIDLYNVFLTTDATVLNGKTITATKGTETVTATMTNGVAKFNLSAGNWEVAGIPITVVDGQTYTKQIVVFAYHYSENDSNPDSGNYPSGYDNHGWTPFAMDLSTGIPNYGSWNPSGANADKLAWFYPKSCMLKYNGTVDYYLSETDETKKEDGITASDVANSSYGGNAMMEWGQNGYRHYWKLVPDQDSKGWTFVVSNAEVLNCKPWNHYDANDNVNRHWYTAKYFGSNVSKKLRSISGGSNFVNNTRNTEVTYARANNTNANIIWDTEVFCDYQYIGLLCCLLAKNNNTQAKFGAGRSASGNSSAIGQGTMNGTGLFYGKSNGTEGVKIFGMENFYGNLWRSIRGLISSSGAIKVKMTHGTADGSTASDYNFDGTGYITACNYGGNNSHGYINHMYVTDKFMVPNGISGSETTYYTDYTWLYTSGTYYPLVGGNWNNPGGDGVFCYGLSNPASYTYASIGATISCKPLAE